ncbi:MAG: hypothetical protein WC548_00550 [Candidatus Pacearchaeota archaeon]
MIEYLALILSIPIGILLARLTNWERDIYTKSHYFPTIVWVLAIFTAVFLSVNKIIGMSLLFSFLTVLVWWKGEDAARMIKRK